MSRTHATVVLASALIVSIVIIHVGLIQKIFRMKGDLSHEIYVWKALHKGGSSEFVTVMSEFCALHGARMISHNKLADLFSGTQATFKDSILPDLDNGLKWNPEEEKYELLSSKEKEANSLMKHVNTGHTCVGVIRNYDSLKAWADVYDIKEVILVRDPRDMIVSAYHSFGWSHGQGNSRIRQMNLSEFAESGFPGSKQFYKRLFEPLIEQINQNGYSNAIILSYDQMVLSFKTFLKKISSFMEFEHPEEISDLMYQLTCCQRIGPTTLLSSLINQNKESTSHTRAILPGNHRYHFSAYEQRNLEDYFSEELSMLSHLFHARVDSVFKEPDLANFSS